MADRYWVGGTASWDGTAGTKWATTSGGAGGASVPTTADDVFFTNLSTGQAVIAAGNTGAKSINCTGFSGIISGVDPITVAGSVTLSAGMTYTHTGTMTISATATLITSGKPFGALTINAPGGTVTLNGALNTATREITIQSGTFDTAGFDVIAGQFLSTTASVRTILLRASTITLSGSLAVNITIATNLTFTAGTSTFVLTSNSANLGNSAGGLVFNDVSFTDTNIGSARGLATSSTYNNLTIAAPTADGVIRMGLSGSATVNGTLSVTGSTFARRVGFNSSTSGTARTLTVATLSADHCDFEDIALAGAASPASPTGAGDCGGNTGITFPAPKTVYRVGTNTTWAGSSSWATTSNGTGSDANFPLVQDTAIIDNATTATSLTLVSYNRGALDMSARTSAFDLGSSAVANFYGSFILGSGVNPTATSAQTYRGRSLSTLTSAGKTINFAMSIQSIGGGLQLGDALLSSSSLGLVNGTFDAVTYPVTLSLLNSSNSNTRTLSMGTQLWTLTSTGTIWTTAATTGLTFNKGTADILLSNNTTTARTVSLGSLTYNKLTIGGTTSTSTTTITGTTTTVLAEIASTKTVAHTISFSANAVTFGTWSVKGTAGNVVTLNSSVAGTRRTFNLTNVTASDIDYLAVRDIECLQADRFYVGANSTNNGNNVNVIFTAAPVVPTAGSNVFRSIFRPVFREIFRPIF